MIDSSAHSSSFSANCAQRLLLEEDENGCFTIGDDDDDDDDADDDDRDDDFVAADDRCIDGVTITVGRCDSYGDIAVVVVDVVVVRPKGDGGRCGDDIDIDSDGAA